MGYFYRGLKKINKEIFWKWAVLSGLVFLVVLLFCQKTELSSSDLGRHIENGRVLFSDPRVLWTNFYSYTEPDNYFINHHWLSGLIYYLVYMLSGFSGLHIFNIIIATSTLLIFFRLARQHLSFFATSILSLPTIFLLSERVEIRPEIFSYLFIGLTWLIIENRQLNISQKKYYLFPLFVFWSNMHIYFFFGLGLSFFWVLSDFLDHYFFSKTRFKEALFLCRKKIYLFLSLLLASLITPNHFNGLLYPFNILRRYGYEIAENQSVFFLDNLSLNINFSIFKILVVVLPILLLIAYLLDRKRRWFYWLSALMFSWLGLKMSRNISIFGLSFLVLSAPAFASIYSFIVNKYRRLGNLVVRSGLLLYSYIFLSAVIFLSGLFLLINMSKDRSFLNKDFGLGLSKGSLRVFEFYEEEFLDGPIFNNYDVGSALIFWLKGPGKVFVDNRPEAYSVSFFKDIYIPMQESSQAWEDAVERYKFKTIIFAHTDSTPWARSFLPFVLSDSRWALVYFDRYYVVLIDRSQYPTEKINDLEITLSDFRSSLRTQANEASVKGRVALANLAQYRHQADLAEEIYRKIIFSDPQNSQAYFSLGYLYSSSSNRSQLIKSLDYFYRGIDLSPYTPKIYDEIGLVYWRLGNYDLAEKAWDKSLKITNDSVTAKDYLRQLKELRDEGKLPSSNK